MYLRIFFLFFSCYICKRSLKVPPPGGPEIYKINMQKAQFTIIGGSRINISGSCGVEKTEIAIYITKLSN